MGKINLDGQLSLFGNEDFDVREIKKDVAPSEKHEPSILQHLPISKDFGGLFALLNQSDFRRNFHLSSKDIAYIETKGIDVIRHHAEDFVAKRLAPAHLPNDGKQTPMRGHPVFVAQHATACCCRGCFEKWHHIRAGIPLTPVQQQYAVDVLMAWIVKEYSKYRHL